MQNRQFLLYGYHKSSLVNIFLLKQKTNLDVFFKIYVCPALLHLKPLTFCVKCDKVLLEDNEIDVSRKNDLSSIHWDICCAWFHYKCENIKSSGINDTNIEWICSNCLVTTASS